MKHRFFIICLCMALMLTMLPLPAAARSASGETGELQVLLKSMGSVSSMEITSFGSYSVDNNPAMRIEKGAQITAAAAGGEVWLNIGGLIMNMGDSVTLTRHAAEGENGLYIAGSQAGKLYCGSLRLTAEGGVLRPVLLIDMEEYLYGVVPYEMSDSFPIEALKAQAVAARTYALQRRADRGSRDYDVVDTTADQVFMGFDPAYVNAIAAVDATRGVCGLYQGEYATCYYTASNGGQTAMAHDILGITSDDGYLAVTDDPYDLENPASRVTSLVLRTDACDLPDFVLESMKASAAEALSAMNMSDEMSDIFIDEIVSVEPHSPLGDEPGRMYQYLTVTYRLSACPMVPVYSKPTNLDRIHALFGRNTFEPVLLGEEVGDPVLLEQEFTCEISVFDQIKEAPGMKISNIDCELVSVSGRHGAECEEFVIELRRYGHGVGMSQRGAQWMAGEYGKTYMEILSFYYPGLTFESRAFAKNELPALGSLPAGVSGAEGTAQIPQAELPALSEGERYAKVTLSTAWSTLNMRESASTESRILTTLANGWRVIVMSEENGWAHVKTADAEGYVSTAYIVME